MRSILRTVQLDPTLHSIQQVRLVSYCTVRLQAPYSYLGKATSQIQLARLDKTLDTASQIRLHTRHIQLIGLHSPDTTCYCRSGICYRYSYCTNLDQTTHQTHTVSSSCTFDSRYSQVQIRLHTLYNCCYILLIQLARSDIHCFIHLGQTTHQNHTPRSSYKYTLDTAIDQTIYPA